MVYAVKVAVVTGALGRQPSLALPLLTSIPETGHWPGHLPNLCHQRVRVHGPLRYLPLFVPPVSAPT